ncbi:uncharacterized protein [Halyomorpha halys]|uniref:uncharacterized protein n=1 Tax=Halyomorpha halys TaxID=286706 RepID=UPI0034D1C3D4
MFYLIHNASIRINTGPYRISFEYRSISIANTETSLRLQRLNQISLENNTLGHATQSNTVIKPALISVPNVNPNFKCIQPSSDIPKTLWHHDEVIIDVSLSKAFKNLCHKEIEILFLHLIKRFQEYKIMYTDASKFGGSVGCAVVTDEEEFHFKLPGSCTTFTGEATAIKEALLHCQAADYQRSAIVTDAMSVLLAMKNPKSTDLTIFEIRYQTCLIRQKGKYLAFIWVPSHCGISGNEKADTAARLARIEKKTNQSNNIHERPREQSGVEVHGSQAYFLGDNVVSNAFQLSDYNRVGLCGSSRCRPIHSFNPGRS